MSRRVRLRRGRKHIEFWCAKCRHWARRGYHGHILDGFTPGGFGMDRPGPASPFFGPGAAAVSMVSIEQAEVNAALAHRMSSELRMQRMLA